MEFTVQSEKHSIFYKILCKICALETRDGTVASLVCITTRRRYYGQTKALLFHWSKHFNLIGYERTRAANTSLVSQSNKNKLKLNERRQAKLTTNRNTITTYLYLTLYDFSPFTRLSPLYTVLEKCRQ